MAKMLDMPKLSPTMEEGVLSAWHKKEGDPVEVDDLLAEVETDKATMEFRSFDKGVLLKILIAPGTNVKLGQAVAILGAAGEDVSALVASAGSASGAANVADAPPAAPAAAQQGASVPPATSKSVEGDKPKAAEAVAATMVPPPEAQQRAKPVVTGSVLTRTERAPEVSVAASGGQMNTQADAANGRVLASPFVRKSARDRGIDLHGAQGTGPGGRIVPEDLDAIATQSRALVRSGSSGGTLAPIAPTLNGHGQAAASNGLAQPESRPLSPMRKTIARRLSESKREVPHFYLTIDVDASHLVRLREQVNEELAREADGKAGKDGKSGAEAPKPLKISLNDLLIKSVAAALVRVPECNAQFTPEAILVHRRVDISVAVAVAEGLVTPVVRNADQKSVVAIAREVRELASRARAKKLKPEEMSDGTFSISNLGMFGIDEFSAVINPPEGAILAVGQVRDVPVIEGDRVVPGKRMSMTLSCDHRVIDGAVGASFLAELRALLERPMRVLTG